MRRVAHLDMDAFYASVELLRYPQLKGLPVVIGGGRSSHAHVPVQADGFARLADYTGRGVITTATYAARAFGVGSAMGMMKAAKLCPQAILLPVDFEEYRKYSRLFKGVIHEVAGNAELMEDRGVDEVYIEFTEIPGGQRGGGRALASLLQKSIFEATGLTCSIGVAPNKLLAKIASELNKPNGISVLLEEDLERVIHPMPCRKINGIGPKASEKLASHGLHTIGELAAQEPQWLQAHFGNKYGAWLYRASHGQDDSPVVAYSEPVSISRETTFERDMHAVRDRAELSGVFTRLCEQLAADLARKGYAARTVGIKLKYDNFKTLTRDSTLEAAISRADDLRRAAGLCLKRAPLERRFRLLGVRAAGLVKV